MAYHCPVIVVSGFLGAGKSRLIETIAASSVISENRAVLDRDAEAIVIEACGLRHPSTEAARLEHPRDVRIVTVVDAVNLRPCLDDDAKAALIKAQILAADCVVLARTDVVDPTEARARVAAITNAPIIDAKTTPATLAAILDAGRTPITGRTSTISDLSERYTRWSYCGPGVLTPEAVDTFLAARPRAAYRVFGQVMCPSKGVAIDVVGRVRQTTSIDSPDETTITAIGAKSAFNFRAMDLAFAEAIVNASYAMGRIACR